MNLFQKLSSFSDSREILAVMKFAEFGSFLGFNSIMNQFWICLGRMESATSTEAKVKHGQGKAGIYDHYLKLASSNL